MNQEQKQPKKEIGEASEKRELIKIEEMSLEEKQRAAQLYHGVGLEAVVDTTLEEDRKRRKEKATWIDKAIGGLPIDPKEYGKEVAQNAALATYHYLSKEYGGRVGDLRAYLMQLEEERERAIAQRDQANARYDDLVAKGIGALAEGYKDLRIDSKEFMEKLTALVETDREVARIDLSAVTEKLADIDGLREQIKTLNEEKKQLTEKTEEYASQLAMLKNEHAEKVKQLSSQITELNSKIKGLESEKTTLTSDLAQLREDYNQLKTAVATLPEAIPYQEIGKRLGNELYDFILKDSKVPDMVIEGVGKFIDFKKYLGLAAERGAKEATKQTEEKLSSF